MQVYYVDTHRSYIGEILEILWNRSYIIFILIPRTTGAQIVISFVHENSLHRLLCTLIEYTILLLLKRYFLYFTFGYRDEYLLK